MRKILQLPTGIACLDDARSVHLDGSKLLINFYGQTQYLPLHTYSSEDDAAVAFDRCLHLLQLHSVADANSKDGPAYLLHDGLLVTMAGVYLVTVAPDSSSVSVRYRDGFTVDLGFSSHGAAAAAVDAIAVAADRTFGDGIIRLWADGPLDVLHIGRRIRDVLHQQGMAVTDFATRLACTRENAHRIMIKDNLDMQMLLRISMILHHDFLQDIRDSVRFGNSQ